MVRKLVLRSIEICILSFFVLLVGCKENQTSSIKNNNPTVPSNPTPFDRQTGVSTSLTLKWKCSDPDGDEIEYNVYLGKNSNNLSIVKNNTKNDSLYIEDLESGTQYYWMVVSKDNNEGQSTGPKWSFMTSIPPTSPSNPSPNNGAIGQLTSILLAWECNDPEKDALKYDLYLGNSTNSLSKIASDIIVSNYQINGLLGNTKYYWKVTAKDIKGNYTSSPFWNFKTKTIDGTTGTLIYNGYSYKTIIIGNQEWTAENLRTTTYNDGTVIVKIKTDSEWAGHSGASFCAYNNTDSLVSDYGYIYDWYVINSSKIQPKSGGWRVPSNDDWNKLIEYLGGRDSAGVKLKSNHGWYLNGNGTDVFGFNGLPGGYRDYYDGNSSGLSEVADWWTSDIYPYINNRSAAISIFYASNQMEIYPAPPGDGCYIRLVRDN